MNSNIQANKNIKLQEELFDHNIPIDDPSITTISNETKPQIVEWVKNWLSKNKQNYSDIPQDEEPTINVAIRPDFASIDLSYSSAHIPFKVYLKSLDSTICAISKKGSVETKYYIEADAYFEKYTPIDILFNVNNGTKMQVLKTCSLDNIFKLFINYPDNVTTSEIEVQPYRTKLNVLFATVTLNKTIQKTPISIDTGFSCNLRSAISDNISIDNFSGKDFAYDRKEIESQLSNPDTYINNVSKRRYVPVGSNVKYKLLQDNDVIKYEITSSRSYSVDNVLEEPVSFVVQLNGVKNSNQSGSLNQGSPNVNNIGSNDLIKDSSNNKWIYIGVGTGVSLIIIGIGIGIVLSKKKKSKSKKQVKVQQHARPNNQHVKTIPTSRGSQQPPFRNPPPSNKKR